MRYQRKLDWVLKRAQNRAEQVPHHARQKRELNYLIRIVRFCRSIALRVKLSGPARIYQQ